MSKTSRHHAALRSASRAENEMWETFENVGMAVPFTRPLYSGLEHYLLLSGG
jgi:hypothetical protein